MNAEVKEVAPCRQHIKVEVTAEEVDKAFDESYDTLRNNVQVRGFRQGHAPRRILERRFAKDVTREVCGKIFEESLTDALKENDLAPMGDPDLDPETLEVKPGEPLTFETELDVRPKFDLPEYKGIKLKEEIEPVTDVEIDEQIDNLRERFVEYEEVDEACKEGDTLEVAITLKAGEKTLIDETGQRVKNEGDRLFGIECPGLVKTLSGLTVGKEADIDLTLPDDFHDKELQGADASAHFVVEKVLRGERPDVDEEFAKRLGMDTVDALKDRIKANILDGRRQEAQQKLEQDLVDQLIEKSSFDLPEAFMERQKKAAFQRNQMQLARMGATREYLEEQREDLEKTSDEETERSVRRTIIFDAIADAEDIQIDQQEFQEHLTNLARSYQTSPAEMLKDIQQRDGLAAMASEIRDIKVSRFLLENADIERAATDNADEKKDEKE